MYKKLTVFIVGPTAVGKTDVAIEVAGSLSTEIISADSRQVYRELSIGTAVPTPAQLGRVKHHLLQHRSVTEYYSAAIYEEESLLLLNRLFENHNTVVLTGGSGLYIQAICEGIDDIPRVDVEIRKTLIERLEKEGLESLRFELRKLDPVSYERIDLKNPKRILKALEVSLSSGKPYSGFLTREKKKRDFRVIKIGLRLDRDVLYERINRRVDEMMEKGLLDEVRKNIKYRDRNALNTVGYKELFDYMDGKHSFEEAVRLIKRNSRHYARRQISWFNRDPEIKWYNPEQVGEIINFINDVA
jgi:tRNA dimethylallyltransferase